QTAFVALQGPASVRAVLEPLGNACLSMNRAVHHRDGGLIAVSDDFFQADLIVAEHRDEGNEHGVSMRRGDSVSFYHAAFVPAVGRPSRVITGRLKTKNYHGLTFATRPRGAVRNARGGLAAERGRPQFCSGKGGWI